MNVTEYREIREKYSNINQEKLMFLKLKLNIFSNNSNLQTKNIFIFY